MGRKFIHFFILLYVSRLSCPLLIPKPENTVSSRHFRHNGVTPRVNVFSKKVTTLRPRNLTEGERPIQTGDIFTPYELLPVAKKLLSKVKHPGRGKGIVSSSASPEILADKIYEGLFQTPKRLVVLDREDMASLDALQALALSGEDIVEGNDGVPIAVRPESLRIIPGKPRQSLYTLLTKNRKPEKNISRTKSKNGLRLKKTHKVESKTSSKHSKLRQVKNVTVKSKRDDGGNEVRTKKKFERRHPAVKRASPTNKGRATCRWMYMCKDQADLDTCRIQTHCNIRPYDKPFNYIKTGLDEDKNEMKKFRKMIGISVIDDEVEKILEARYLRRQLLEPKRHFEILEGYGSVQNYFYNILQREYGGMTTPTYKGVEQSEESTETPILDKHNFEELKAELNSDSDYLQRRRNMNHNQKEHPLGKIPKPSKGSTRKAS